jgi:isoleucyl-tRNA synthetase
MAAEANRSWDDTLNLPRTAFPMRAQLREREPQMIERWQKAGLYRQVREARRGAPLFVLHDGPPYANGPIHLGTALNKILKDIAVKSHLLLGYDTPFVPGWDCHGLPIELNVEKELGARKQTMDPVTFRQYCRAYAERFIEIQKQGFIRLGCLGDWEHPYKTMDPKYQATIVRVLGQFVKAGLVYRGLRSVLWCYTDRTALAEAEIEYQDRTSPSIYVRFRMDPASADRVFGPPWADRPVYAIIWTTTPWTLPANVGIAFHPEYEYGLYEVDGTFWIVATALWPAVRAATGVEGHLVQTVRGAAFDRTSFQHPFLPRTSLGILADFVTLEQGTGLVHTAPGHGLEDFLATRPYDLPVLSPVDDEGRFTEEAGVFAGLHVFEANPRIIELLRERGALVGAGTIQHSYPHCWRCKQPLIFRATEQWFIRMDAGGFRERALAVISTVRWVPPWGEERIRQMIAARPDWCISRQRLWGVPIPQFYCKACGALLQDDRVFDHVADIFERETADAWYARPADELVPPGARCSACGGTTFEKGMDILDVWFDSGTSHEAVLGTSPDLPWPADLYLEGHDQYRGWFNSSLLVGVLTRGASPYRTCVTHGFVVDEAGQKMSKSLGNVIEPETIFESFGAEILRAWAAMVDFQEDMRLSENILQMVATQYRKVRNTIRFMLGNLYDFDPTVHAQPVESLPALDQYMLAQLMELERRVIRAYEDYRYHVVYHALYQFCNQDLSAFYLDVLKDRLYCAHPDDPGRRAAQTVLFETTRSLLRLMAPIFSFTADEAWAHLPAYPGKPAHVFLDTVAPPYRWALDSDGIERIRTFRDVREVALKALEEARAAKQIGSSLDAHVTVHHPPKDAWFRDYLPELREVLMVSQVTLVTDPDLPAQTYWVEVRRADGRRCDRCWMYDPAVGDHPRWPTLCPRCIRVVERLNL